MNERDRVELQRLAVASSGDWVRTGQHMPLDQMAVEYFQGQPCEFPITAIAYAFAIRNAYKAGYLAAQPVATTVVPVEPGPYWLKEPQCEGVDWRPIWLSHQGMHGFVGHMPGNTFTYHVADFPPGTLWCRIPLPQADKRG